MEILFFGSILFIAYQLRPQNLETEEEKKKQKEQQENQTLCETLLFGSLKLKYPNEEDSKIKERVTQSIKKMG